MHKDFQLTEQENEVMYWLIRAVPINIIARKLNITEDITIACCNRVFKKTKTKNEVQLIILAIQKGIITVKDIDSWDLESFRAKNKNKLASAYFQILSSDPAETPKNSNIKINFFMPMASLWENIKSKSTQEKICFSIHICASFDFLAVENSRATFHKRWRKKFYQKKKVSLYS